MDYNVLRTLTVAKCVLRVLCPSLHATADIGGWNQGKTSVQDNANGSRNLLVCLLFIYLLLFFIRCVCVCVWVETETVSCPKEDPPSQQQQPPLPPPKHLITTNTQDEWEKKGL